MCVSAAPSDNTVLRAAPRSSLCVRCGSTRDVTPPAGAHEDGGAREGFCSVLQVPKNVSPFSLFSIASFAPISFAIKAKENDLLPLEKNRVKLDDDSDDDEEGKEGQESSSSAANTNPAATPPCVVVEEKRPQLTQEELEAKQGLSIRFQVLGREKCANTRLTCYARSTGTAGWDPRLWTPEPRGSVGVLHLRKVLG